MQIKLENSPQPLSIVYSKGSQHCAIKARESAGGGKNPPTLERQWRTVCTVININKQDHL